MLSILSIFLGIIGAMLVARTPTPPYQRAAWGAFFMGIVGAVALAVL